jgi:hypothetical protein
MTRGEMDAAQTSTKEIEKELENAQRELNSNKADREKELEQARLERERAAKEVQEANQLKEKADQLREAAMAQKQRLEVESKAEKRRLRDAMTVHSNAFTRFESNCPNAQLADGAREVAMIGLGTVLAGTELVQKTSITLKLTKCKGYTAFGVCKLNYKREAYPNGRGAWSLWSHGLLRSDNVGVENHHPSYRHEGVTIKLCYTPQTHSKIYDSVFGGTLEWSVQRAGSADAEPQRTVTGIDTGGHGVAFCVGGADGTTWTIVDNIADAIANAGAQSSAGFPTEIPVTIRRPTVTTSPSPGPRRLTSVSSSLGGSSNSLLDQSNSLVKSLYDMTTTGPTEASAASQYVDQQRLNENLLVQTSNVAKYHVGMQVTGMGGNTIAGIVLSIVPDVEGATQGPGRLTIGPNQ